MVIGGKGQDMYRARKESIKKLKTQIFKQLCAKAANYKNAVFPRVIKKRKNAIIANNR